MFDPFQFGASGVSAPARDLASIVPHDTNSLPMVTKAIYVGIAGDITVRAIDSMADTTFKSVPAGTILPIRIAWVRATGTTGGGIVAFF